MTTAERDALLGVGTYHDIGYFTGASAQTLRALLEGGAADPDDAQNSAPTFGEFAEWLELNPKFTAHGYVVSEKRDDCRVSIEGVESGPVTAKEMAAFVDFQRDADEFTATRKGCRSWYD